MSVRDPSKAEMTRSMRPVRPGRTDRNTQELRLLTNVPALDGLRGFAVITVVYFHAALLMGSLRAYARGGGLGVDAFFVLSGFLITALLLREQTTTGSVRLGAFYQRRALRLLPALIVLLAAHSIYAAVTEMPMAPERQSVISILFYFSNTPLHRLPMSEGLGGLWSLAVEEQFYLIWPLIFLVVFGVRRRASMVVWLTLGLIAAVCAYPAMLFHQGTSVLVL